MQLSKTQNVAPVGFNMTPMIDIVFLLIIFFMTVSQLDQNVLSPLELPVSSFGDDRAAPAALVLNIDSQGQLQVNNEVIQRDALDALLAQTLARADADDKTPHVRLRCAEDCSTTNVNFVFDRLSEMGFESVTVAVRKQ